MTLFFLTICLYYFRLLLPVIHLNLTRLLGAVALLTLPLLFKFSVAFNQNSVFPDSVCNTEELSSWFHSTCQTVLDTVAPFKFRQPKTKSEPWLNDTTHAVRRECRRAERKRKKDKLQVSLRNAGVIIRKL